MSSDRPDSEFSIDVDGITSMSVTMDFSNLFSILESTEMRCHRMEGDVEVDGPELLASVSPLARVPVDHEVVTGLAADFAASEDPEVTSPAEAFPQPRHSDLERVEDLPI